jgi:serine phosphatase RsbU (regulator of sigma subunit)
MAVGLVDLVLRSERVDDGTFATIISATYDAGTGNLELLAAGHPPPVLLDPVFGHRTIELDQGPLLGVVDRAEHVVNRLRLREGQAMLLYTDGLIEGRARPGSSARLDDEGLHELLRDLPEEDLRHPQRIIDAANLRHGADLPDDVALLVLVAPPAPSQEALTSEANVRAGAVGSLA